MGSSSIISLKGQDFVGGIGKSSELQMHWTAGYFPLPWPAKESSFKTHLPVNILAWLWVISPVWTRPSRAWRCTCTNPKTALVTSDFPFSPTASLLIVMIMCTVAHGYLCFLTSSPFQREVSFLVFISTTTKICIILNALAPGSNTNNTDRLKFWYSNRNNLINQGEEIPATRVLIYKIQCIWIRALINDKKMWHHNRANE